LSFFHKVSPIKQVIDTSRQYVIIVSGMGMLNPPSTTAMSKESEGAAEGPS